MNPNIIKRNLSKKVGLPIKIVEYGPRCKNNCYYGYIKEMYPHIFLLNINGCLKSYSYSDVICGEIVIDFI